MKISHSTLLSWSLVACGSSSAFAFSTSRSRSPHRTPRAVAFTAATGTSRVSTGPQSSTTRLNDIKFLIDTPLTEDETIRMAEMDEIQKVKEFISWLDYKTPEKTKAGTPKASSSGAVSSGGAFIGTGDIAADAEAAARIAREDAISASTASATDDHGDDVASTPNNNKKELPRLRTTLGSTVLLTGIFEKQSNSNYEPLLFNLLNANSLTEDSPSNFKFDSIVTLVNEDKVALPLAKKKAMSRESRYSGLMDKLSIKSSGSGGGIPTKEEMTNVSSWIMHISKEESSTVLPQVAELIKGGQLASLNNVVILMDGVTTKEKEEEVCNEWNVLKGSVDGPDDDGVKCTLVAVGELYDGDGNNLYHVGKLGSEPTTTNSAVATEDTADTTIGDASTSTAPPSIPSAPKLSRKEAYRIAAHSLALESTVNQALMVYQRDTIAKAATKDDPDATNANADIFLDPIEKKILAELDEKYPYPEFQPMTSDEFIEHNKKTYKIQEARKVARAELEAQYGIEKDSMAKAEEKNEKAKQVKFPGDDILEDRLIMAMREMAFSRTMELDVLVEKGVKVSTILDHVFVDCFAY